MAEPFIINMIYPHLRLVGHDTNWMSILGTQIHRTNVTSRYACSYNGLAWIINVEYCLYTDNSAQSGGAHMHEQIA